MKRSLLYYMDWLNDAIEAWMEGLVGGCAFGVACAVSWLLVMRCWGA